METESEDLLLDKEKEHITCNNGIEESCMSLTNSRIPHRAGKNKDTAQKVIVKRSSRRRSIGNSKSILQSAIARKEKSFNDYSNPPKKISRQIKPKVDIKKNGLVTVTASELNKPLLNVIDNSNSSKKRFKLVENEISNQKENGLRRSLRMISSEKEELHRNLSNEEVIKDYLQQHTLFKETSKLCCCLETKDIYSELDSQFCSAIDSIDEKLIGCSRLVDVKSAPMLRPSTRIPFGVFCEIHVQRLKKHNCCPSCGVFCTQGEFLQCMFKHYFHKECLIPMEKAALCPHCGDFSNNEVVQINMHSLKSPVILPVQMPYQINCE